MQIYCLRTFTTDTTGQLDVLWHDCNTLGVNGTQVGIFKESNQVGLGGFLKGQDGRTLESKIGLEILGDLTDKTLEWQLADEKVGGLLVTTDLTKSDSSRAVTVGLLDSTSCWGGLTSCLGGKLLTRSLSSSGFTCGLIRDELRRREGQMFSIMLFILNVPLDASRFYLLVWYGPFCLFLRAKSFNVEKIKLCEPIEKRRKKRGRSKRSIGSNRIVMKGWLAYSGSK